MATKYRIQNFYLSFELLLLVVSFLLLIGLWSTQRTISQTITDRWSRRGLNGLIITNLVEDASNANRFYAASRDEIGVRFSEDEGETWLPYHDGLNLNGSSIESLISCPSGWLLAGTWGNFVYRRTATTGWTQSNNGLTQEFIPALACGAATVVFAATYNEGVFRSDNQGGSWQPINQGLTQLEVLSLVYTNGRLYAGTASGLFERQDNATSWQPIGLTDRRVNRMMITTDTLWAGTDQGVFRTPLSTPTNWTAVSALVQSVLPMALDGDQRLYAGTRDAGIYRLDGATWQSFNNGLTAKRIYAIRPRGANQSTLLVGTEDGLWINQVQPLPTLMPTPTNTPIPTPTSTPTPGIKAIWLQNVPQEELAGSAMVTYTIDLENGPFDLAKVVVRNPLPDEMEFVSESASAPSGWAFSLTERTVKWTLPTLVAGATARLVYRAQRHTPTSTPTPTLIETQPETPTATPTPTSTRSAATPTLTQTVLPQTLTPTATLPALATSITITKTGPSVVANGAEIRYRLTVANHITRTFTGLTIVDLIPVGAEVVDFGGGALTMPPSAMLQWQVPRLNAQSVVTRTFAIRPSSNQSQVVNELYFVDVIENGVLQLRAVGKAAVVTTIVGGGLEPLPAPLSLPTAPLTATTPIINNGAVVNWEYPGFNGQLGSNGVRNPMHRLYLPFIPR